LPRRHFDAFHADALPFAICRFRHATLRLLIFSADIIIDIDYLPLFLDIEILIFSPLPATLFRRRLRDIFAAALFAR
jgi:hypothetical protein